MVKFQQHVVVRLLLNYALNEREYFRGVEEWVLEGCHAVEVAQALLGVLFCEGLDEGLLVLCEEFGIELESLALLLGHVFQSDAIERGPVCYQLVQQNTQRIQVNSLIVSLT
jgi:hypothetical protein